MVTEQEAKDMRDSLRLLESNESQKEQAQQEALRTLAQTWYNQQGIDIQSATTRTQALDNYNRIRVFRFSETDNKRKNILGQKLREANEKYKEVKKVNPNS